jgi:hypothetical protein
MKTKFSPPRRRVVSTDPAWEAMKAATRNLDHDDAVQECFFLQKQFHSQWGHVVSTGPVDLNLILRTLTDKRIPFVLTGTHGISSWTGRPRATLDVDLLVKSGRNYARAVSAVKALYPQLEARVFFGVTAFFPPGQEASVIDVTYPHRADIEETLAHPVWTENKETGLRYRIPDLEPALSNKYGAMLTLSRESRKRRQDILDFEWMVAHSTSAGRRPIDLQRLEALGEKVWPRGGGKEILRLVECVKAGQAISLESLQGGM